MNLPDHYTFKMEEHKVKAKKRKLKATWTLESAADMKASYGPGVKKMLNKMIMNQLIEEIKQSYGTWKKTHESEDKGFVHFKKNTWPTLQRIRTL